LERIFSLLVSLTILLGAQSSFAATSDDDTCLQWFQRIKVSPANKDCELVCASTITDMGTFECPSRCDEFCRQVKSTVCPLKNSWKDKIKNGRPPNWPYLREKASGWSSDEVEILANSLAKLSDAFPVDELKGIYKLSKPEDIFSAGTPSSYLGGQIVLYQSAFRSREEVVRYIIHELGHHLHESRLTKAFEDYKKTLKWTVPGRPRPGAFIEKDGKDSAEEDFANNFEAYILEPARLKKTTPLAFQWMAKQLKSKYNLKDCKK
jgi:hypothetical protein